MATGRFVHSISQMKIQADNTALIVLGNQGADLDSIASSVVLAYHLADRQPEKAPIALIAMPRRDLRLRPEVAFIFARAGIEPKDLVFSDDVDLGALLARGAELVLVDHNNVDHGLAAANQRVTAIIDHHHDEGRFPEAKPRLIAKVGSTATLIAEIVLAEKGEIDTSAALLLLGAILMDTVNLSDKVGRSTARDREMADRLLLVTGVGRQTFFAELLQSQYDLGGLSSAELLKRDFKRWTSPAGSYGMSTVLVSLKRWQERDRQLCSTIASFACQKNVAILIVMLVSQVEDFRRELIVYCRNKDMYAALESYLSAQGLDLSAVQDAESIPGRAGLIGMYRQGNVAMSRKKLQPLVQAFFSGHGET